MLQRQALCNHLPGLQPLLEAMPTAKTRAQQVRLNCTVLSCRFSSGAG